jgi:hypothetical protein
MRGSATLRKDPKAPFRALWALFIGVFLSLLTAEMVLAIASRNSIFICGNEPLQPGERRLHWFLLSEAALHGVAFSWKL